MMVLRVGAVSYERGTPVGVKNLRGRESRGEAHNLKKVQILTLKRTVGPYGGGDVGRLRLTLVQL